MLYKTVNLTDIYLGHAVEELKLLPSESVHCVVTSPPYFGLRSYLDKDNPLKEKEIGLEQTPEEYVENLVCLFREIRRVLRKDGNVWLNLGDSFWGGKGSNGLSKARRTADERGYLQSNRTVMMDTRPSDRVPNLFNALKGRFESGIFFFGSPDPRGCPAESVDILIYDKRSPDSIFKPFFTAKRVSIKNGQDDFCEIGNFFHSPVKCFIGKSLRLALPTDTAEGFVNISENIGIIITTGDLDTDAAIRGAVMLPVKNSKASLPVKIAGEPVTEGIPSAIPVFNSISFNAGTETISKVQAVNKPVALLDSSKFGTGSLGYFAIGKASDQETLFVLHNGTEVRCLSVRHLHLLSNNSLTPYCSILDKEVKRENHYRAKQEIGVPFIVRQALIEDGWICRQTIIWQKKNPLPESVLDRCTKSHEYIFLLSKTKSYFFDSYAIKETSTKHPSDWNPDGTPKRKSHVRGEFVGKGAATKGLEPFRKISETRNRRSVWTTTTQMYKGAHFATMPPKIAELCILAGTSEKGCCADCGSPYVRKEKVVGTQVTEQMLACGSNKEGLYTGQATKEYEQGKAQNPSDTKRRILESMSKIREYTFEKNCNCNTTEIKPCTVLDPFGGSGTTAWVANHHKRKAIVVELNEKYLPLIEERLQQPYIEKVKKQRKEKPLSTPTQLSLLNLFEE